MRNQPFLYVSSADYSSQPRIRAKAAAPRTKKRRVENKDTELQKKAVSYVSNLQSELGDKQLILDAERDKKLELEAKNAALMAEIEELRMKNKQQDFTIYTRENDIRKLNLEAAKDKEFIGARITYNIEESARIMCLSKEKDAEKARVRPDVCSIGTR